MKRPVTVYLLVALLCSIGLLSPNVPAQETAAPQSTSLKVAGLQEKVTVRRDERGIPYIQANNDHDLYFAQGYVTGSDRLWQMDIFRRIARGELSEVFGVGPNNSAFEEDKRHRTLGFAQVAEAEAAQASPQAKGILEAYADGVNAYIASLDAKSTPPEFQLLQYKPKPWKPADSLLVVKNFFEVLSSSWRLDIMRAALADLPAEKRAALLVETSPLDVLVVGSDAQKPDPAVKSATAIARKSTELLRALAKDEEVESRSLSRFGLNVGFADASNNWVVSGKHTASGKPLLANDPHLPASAPSIWYMVHLSAPGVRVAGVTSPGLPGVVIGHNDQIAWGFTNVGPDVQDIYLEQFDPKDPHRYLTPTGWRDVEIRHEEIKVRKGFSDSATDTQTLDVAVTRHGPIVLEKDGKRYCK